MPKVEGLLIREGRLKVWIWIPHYRTNIFSLSYMKYVVLSLNFFAIKEVISNSRWYEHLIKIWNSRIPSYLEFEIQGYQTPLRFYYWELWAGLLTDFRKKSAIKDGRIDECPKRPFPADDISGSGSPLLRRKKEMEVTAPSIASAAFCCD